MKWKRSTVVTAVALAILLAALPSALRDTIETGRVYLFSRQFLEELPQRFTGPGRLRFLLQPALAIFLGWRGGLRDAQAGRLPYLHALLFGAGGRREALRSGVVAIRDLVAMGVVLDALAQLLIYRQVHPGAALLIGPILIGIPYALARALSNRAVSMMRRRSSK